MLIRTLETKLDEGNFRCPTCQRECSFTLVHQRRYFSLLFLPLFPISEPRRRVRCQRCKEEFEESVLQVAQEPALPLPKEPPSAHLAEPNPLKKEAPSEYRSGDRVLGRWDFFWYPGTVVGADPRGLRVKFDDGDEAVLAANLVCPLELAVGQRAFARRLGETQYTPGVLTSVRGNRVRIRFENDAEEDTTVAVLRMVRGEVDYPWKVGDRVLAFWPPEPFLYPGRVFAVKDKVWIHIHYDDGDQGFVTPDMIFALQLKVGDLVFARWNRGRNYFPGHIAQLEGERLLVRYENAKQEWTLVSMVRMLPPFLEEEYRRQREQPAS